MFSEPERMRPGRWESDFVRRATCSTEMGKKTRRWAATGRLAHILILSTILGIFGILPGCGTDRGPVIRARTTSPDPATPPVVDTRPTPAATSGVTGSGPSLAPGPGRLAHATGLPTTVAPPSLVVGLRKSGTNSKGFPEYTNEKDGTVLVLIPGGTLLVGSNGPDNEKPPRSVTLPPFLMARVPVTNAQFARYLSATGRDAGRLWKEHASTWGDQAPVVCVSWDDATAYCLWARLQLPTEEQWELAARGTQGSTWPWGNTWDATRCRNSVDSPAAGAAPVGRYPSGASPFGCLDMAGNVWQWTASWYERPQDSATPDDELVQDYRVMRGGAWHDFNPANFRGACRIGIRAANRTVHSYGHGFRCARSL